MNKFGIAITTRNRSEWMKSLYESIQNIPNCKEIVIVNDGPEYDWAPVGDNTTYIINSENLGISKSKNIGIRKLLKNTDIQYIFTIEDDVVIKDQNIFKDMISASQRTGLSYFNFPAHSWESGEPFKRTPTVSIDYKDLIIDFFPNIVAAFSFYTRDILEEVGIFDEDYRNCWFDVDHTYKCSKTNKSAPFWYFPCISNIDKYIELVEESKLNSQAHGDDWQEQVSKYAQVFVNKNSITVNQIPRCSINNLKIKLKQIYEKNNIRS